MAVTYTILFDVKPEQDERFRALLDGVLDAMREEPMFLDASLHRDTVVEHRYMLCETWNDHQDVVEVQLARPYRAEWHESLPDLLAQPRIVGMWHPIRRDSRGQPLCS